MDGQLRLRDVAFVLVGAMSMLQIGIASGAAQRTFVASTGNDAGACSLNQPCRSFAAAIAKTNAGGEVIVLDSAGYGKVTITQAVSIIAPPGIYAGISVFSGDDGITVNAGATDKVTLRGLTINGQGGNSGILFLTGVELEIDRCIVSGLVDGIEIAPAAGTTTIADSVVERNSGAGIFFDDRLSGTATALLTAVRVNDNGLGLLVGVGYQVQARSSVFHHNDTLGVSVQALTNGGATILDMAHCLISDNGNLGIQLLVVGSAGTFIQALLSDNVITNHANAGVLIFTPVSAPGGIHAVLTRNAVRGFGTAVGIEVVNPHSEAILDDNVVSQTSVGVSAQNSAIVHSRGNNMVDDNTTNQSGAVGAANTL